MSPLPSRSDRNAILSPRGDHAGKPSVDGLFVRFTGFDPLAFITYTSSLPSRLVCNASRVPSGDQVGRKSKAPSKVRRGTVDPSAFITQIWGGPARPSVGASAADRDGSPRCPLGATGTSPQPASVAALIRRDVTIFADIRSLLPRGSVRLLVPCIEIRRREHRCRRITNRAVASTRDENGTIRQKGRRMRFAWR